MSATINHHIFDWIFEQFNVISTEQRNAMPVRRTFLRPAELNLRDIKLDFEHIRARYDMHPSLFEAFIQKALNSDDAAVVQKIKDLLILVRLKDDGTDYNLEQAKNRVASFQGALNEYERDVREEEIRVDTEAKRVRLKYQNDNLENVNRIFTIIREAYDLRDKNEPNVWSKIVIEQVEGELFFFERTTADDVIAELDNWSHASLQSLIRLIVQGHKRWFIDEVIKLTNANFKNLAKSEPRSLDLFDKEKNSSLINLQKQARLETAFSQTKMEIVQKFYDGEDGFDHLYDLMDMTVANIPEMLRLSLHD